MNKLLDVVKLLQRNNVENTEITLHFEELENADKTISFYFLTIPYNEVPDIENVQDIERYIERSFRR